MKYGIYIGTSKETIQEASKAILEILNAKADQETIRCALSMFGSISEAPSNVSLNNIHITSQTLPSLVDTEENDQGAY